MAGYMTLSLGGYTAIFVLTFLIMLAILFGILVYRQIQRLRNNSARKTINSTVAYELSRKGREVILRGVEAVHAFRKIHFPKFTDCTMISEHANATHVYRMIAFDEIIRDIDRQLEFINPELVRTPGESTYSYLKRIKTTTLPELEDEFIARLGFLHEWCRFRADVPFGKQELEEVRFHLKTFLSILNKNQQLTSIKLPVLNSFLLTKSKSLEHSRGLSIDGLSNPIHRKNSHKSPSPRSVANEGDHHHGAANRRLPSSQESKSMILNSRIALKPKSDSVEMSSDGSNNQDATGADAPIKSTVSTGVQESNKPMGKTNSSLAQNFKKGGEANSEIGTVVSKMWENMKKIMGFSPDCKNGGHKNLRGDCVCQKNYRGEYCEHIVCLNNSTVEIGPAVLDPLTTTEFCKCPYPDFISGKHCEMVRCHNGGRDLGNGHCACVDGWYTGQFCQYYTSSWILAIGLPVLGVAFLIMCCVICRLDLCPRRRPTRHTQRSRRYYTTAGNSSSLQPPQSRSQAQHHFGPHYQSHQRQHLLSNGLSADGRSVADRTASLTLFNQEIAAREQALLIQQNLLNESMMRNGVGGTTSIPQGYVVRLEHIPVYNPRLFHQSDSAGSGFTSQHQHQSGFKIEPPPSYDQAVLTCPSLSSNILPPNYSPLNPRADDFPDTSGIDGSRQPAPSNSLQDFTRGQPPPPPNRSPPQPPSS